MPSDDRSSPADLDPALFVHYERARCEFDTLNASIRADATRLGEVRARLLEYLDARDVDTTIPEPALVELARTSRAARAELSRRVKTIAPYLSPATFDAGTQVATLSLDLRGATPAPTALSAAVCEFAERFVPNPEATVRAHIRFAAAASTTRGSDRDTMKIHATFHPFKDTATVRSSRARDGGGPRCVETFTADVLGACLHLVTLVAQAGDADSAD